ncbi:uncharacterized protein LOC112568919 [Pomacea canaliculata]|uniref:uncharacterized protein LOC112568919 n=1 Tax=Pomacea canaliculata TaxID=400727 RepID=UPI000D7254C7|nr:uncharacterized protein LOC112568919 [Pomacea canaliculata]
MACRQWILCCAALLTAVGYSALEIENCPSGERKVLEYTTVRVACGQCKDSMAWYVGDDKDKKYVGNCTETNCEVQDKSPFNLKANKPTNPYHSTLIILNISRMDEIVVSCKCDELNNKDSKSCKLIIKVPISIVPGSCSVHLSGSKVYGVCTIQWLHHRDNNTFMCNWRLTYKNKTQDIPHFQDPTTSTTHDFDRYKRRSCKFVAEMPGDEGDYTYSIRVSSHPENHFSKTFYIGSPQTHRTGVSYGIAAAAVILPLIAAVIIVCIVKRRTDIRNWKTQTPSVGYAVPSDNLYTIAATTIENHDEDDYVTLPETIENDVCGPGSSKSPEAGTAAQQASEERKSLPSKITSSRDDCYTNVTGMQTGSGFGIHEGPLRPGYGDPEPDTRVDYAGVDSEDEYNILHVQVHCSTHEDHDNNYSRIHLK